MKWVHLIPRLPPPVCGVADYAGCLAAALQQRHGMESVLLPLAGDEGWRERLMAECRESDAAQRGGKSDAAQCVPAVLLHYSGYGYAKRGAPFHLLNALTRLRRSCPEVQLVTMFHELFATGSPMCSAFWFSPLQRRVAARLARLSDAVVTNRRASADWLEARMPRGRKARVYPVFSNFGEDASPKAVMERPARLVMFGGGPGRSEAFWQMTEAALDRLDLTELTVVSQPLPLPDHFNARFRARQTGTLDPQAMAEELRHCRFGLLDYNPDFLGKSGVLAAYAAFGVIPLLAQGRGMVSEDLEEDRHFLSPQDLPMDPPLTVLQSNLRAWYDGHSQAATADGYARLLAG